MKLEDIKFEMDQLTEEQIKWLQETDSVAKLHSCIAALLGIRQTLSIMHTDEMEACCSELLERKVTDKEIETPESRRALFDEYLKLGKTPEEKQCLVHWASITEGFVDWANTWANVDISDPMRHINKQAA